MTSTAPGGDVRGFYLALGVELPGWAHTEAPVRCFADPGAHQHEDRDASCSVNLVSGAFNCHGCGAHGGAYDAALATGFLPREAIEVMIAHGLTQPRAPRAAARNAPAAGPRDASPAPAERASTSARATGRDAPAHGASGRPRVFAVDGDRVEAWAEALGANRGLLDRLRAERGWDEPVLREFGVGFDGERITVPIGGERGGLQGLLRLRIEAWQRPKVLAAAGTRLGLIPHPGVVVGPVVLVEGPSDMLAARSAGLPAIAVPGTHAWRTEWALLFGGREVTVVMDCDRPGRQAAARIALDVERGGAGARLVELAPERDDGYDLTDWLRDGGDPGTLLAGSGARETFNRITPASGDVWTVQIGAAMPMSRGFISPDGRAGAVVLGPGNGRSWGCARY